MKPQIGSPFAVPIALAQLAESTRLNLELQALFLARELSGEQYANRHATMRIGHGMFESRFDLFRWPEPCIRELREFCWNQLYQVIGETSHLDAKELSQITGRADAWFHITRRGGYFGLHNHPMASWSGVYCVTPGDADLSSGGLLSFPDPNGAVAMFADPANQRLKIPYSHNTREYRLQQGQLIIFPSWLMHQVTPYNGATERITVAFNAWFQISKRDESTVFFQEY